MVDGQMDGLSSGWVDGWVGGWMRGWKEERKHSSCVPGILIVTWLTLQFRFLSPTFSCQYSSGARWQSECLMPKSQPSFLPFLSLPLLPFPFFISPSMHSSFHASVHLLFNLPTHVPSILPAMDPFIHPSTSQSNTYILSTCRVLPSEVST